MGDVAQLNSEQENLRKIRARLLQWDAKDSPLAPLTSQQIDSVDVISQKWKEVFEVSRSSTSWDIYISFHFRRVARHPPKN